MRINSKKTTKFKQETTRALRSRFPEATVEECHRFALAFPGEEAEERLGTYLSWRCQHELDTDDFEDADAYQYGNYLVLDDSDTDEDDGVVFNTSIDTDSAHEIAFVRSILETSHGAYNRIESFLTALTETESVDEEVTDLQDWREACSQALSVARTNLQREKSDPSKSPEKKGRFRRRSRDQAEKKTVIVPKEDDIPQMLFCHFLHGQPIRDVAGHRILQHLPAQIDMTHLSAELFVSCIALYLDRKVCRDDEETLTLFIDVRPGAGWPNPPAFAMVKFIREVAHQLHALYPCRLHRCVLFPVPRAAFYLWHMIRAVLPVSHQLIVMVPGGAALESPVPSKLKAHVSMEALQLMEETRLKAFCV
jgi:hypothetical protein